MTGKGVPWLAGEASGQSPPHSMPRGSWGLRFDPQAQGRVLPSGSRDAVLGSWDSGHGRWLWAQPVIGAFPSSEPRSEAPTSCTLTGQVAEAALQQSRRGGRPRREGRVEEGWTQSAVVPAGARRRPGLHGQPRGHTQGSQRLPRRGYGGLVQAVNVGVRLQLGAARSTQRRSRVPEGIPLQLRAATCLPETLPPRSGPTVCHCSRHQDTATYPRGKAPGGEGTSGLLLQAGVPGQEAWQG